MVQQSWDDILQEYCVNTGHIKAAALAKLEDLQFYAAAPIEGDEGWNLLFKEDHQEEILQDDESTRSVTINETQTLKAALETDLKVSGAPKNGLWLGGEKFKVLQRDPEFDTGAAEKFTWVLATRPKKGVHILATKRSVLVCLYDEEKGQTSGNCKHKAIEMANYLAKDCEL